MYLPGPSSRGYTNSVLVNKDVNDVEQEQEDEEEEEEHFIRTLSVSVSGDRTARGYWQKRIHELCTNKHRLLLTPPITAEIDTATGHPTLDSRLQHNTRRLPAKFTRRPKFLKGTFEGRAVRGSRR